jgi:hypothetical protein
LWRKKLFREVTDTEGRVFEPLDLWPNLLEVCCIRFKEKVGFQDRGGSTLIALNAGLMKPRKGFTPVTGKKNYGWASIFKCLTKSSVLFILAVRQEVAARKQHVVARS